MSKIEFRATNKQRGNQAMFDSTTTLCPNNVRTIVDGYRLVILCNISPILKPALCAAA